MEGRTKALRMTGAGEQMLFARAQRRVLPHAHRAVSPSLPQLPLPLPQLPLPLSLLPEPPSPLPLTQQKHPMPPLRLLAPPLLLPLLPPLQLPLQLVLPMLLPMLPSHQLLVLLLPPRRRGRRWRAMRLAAAGRRCPPSLRRCHKASALRRPFPDMS